MKGSNISYIFFNYPYDNLWPDEDGYYSICMKDLRQMENVLLVNYPMDHKNFLLRLIQRIHCSGRLNKYVNLPYKEKWYPLYFDSNFINSNRLCFIFSFYMEISYLKYLKYVYQNAIFIVLSRDLVSTAESKYKTYMDSGLIDYWVTYDEGDAQKYGMIHYPQMQSKIDIPNVKSYKYDVFFAGRAKNRMKKILEVYDYLTASGQSCFFYIVGAGKGCPERKGIVYASRMMSYKNMLICNSYAKCLLDVNQENALGYTSRFMEAVLYNKKLLTDNKNVQNSPFYKEDYIRIFNKAEDISIDFINSEINVDYKYKGEFSPKSFLLFLEKVIVKNI